MNGDLGRPIRDHRRPDHDYPELPPWVGICDDETAGGRSFFYALTDTLVHEDDLQEAQEALLKRAGSLNIESPLLPAGLTDGDIVTRQRPARKRRVERIEGTPLVSLYFTPEEYAAVGADPVVVVRELRGIQSEKSPKGLRAHVNHVLTLQSHLKWSPGRPPIPALPLGPLPGGPNLPGAGVRVGVVDTGLDDQAWLSGRWDSTQDPVTEELDEEQDGRLDFEAGHGTFIAGIVLQHAPGADVVVRRLDDWRGMVDDVELMKQVKSLLEPDDGPPVDVLSISFGASTMDNLPTPALCSMLAEAMAANPDLVIVAAAGNDSSTRPFWPAAMSRVIGVGALTADRMAMADFSNHGQWVDAWARGVDVHSTFVSWPGGDLAGRVGELALDAPPTWPAGSTVRLPPDWTGFGGWALWSGTSFAAPRVAGAIAAALRPGTRTGREVVFDLVTNSLRRFAGVGLVDPGSYA